MSSGDNTGLIGRVKWFNNKSGYGFITHEDSDVFVHHSGLSVKSNDMFKYLMEGEYVSFTKETTTGSNHKWQAANVTGVNGGPLMCETRDERRPEMGKTRTTKSRGSADDERASNADADEGWSVADGSRYMGM